MDSQDGQTTLPKTQKTTATQAMMTQTQETSQESHRTISVSHDKHSNQKKPHHSYLNNHKNTR